MPPAVTRGLSALLTCPKAKSPEPSACALAFQRWCRRGVERERERRELHLLPGLVAPVHVARRIRIRLVCGGVVVPRAGADFRALRQAQWLLEDVIGLPVEVVARHVENGL